MKRIIARLPVLIGLATYGFVLLSGNASAITKKTLDVGIVLRLNDKFNESIESMTTGIEAAKSLFEKRHPGVKINLHKYSHDAALESVVAATNRLSHDKIPAVIGGELSEESFVLRDKLGELKTVFITPTSSNPAVTEDHPYAFRACFSDRLVAGQLANFTIDYLKPKSIGVVHNVSSPYTDFLSKQFIETLNERFSKLGADKRIPVLEEKVLRDTMDFDTQIDHFMANKVTHVAMLVHQSDLVRFVLQASNKGYFPVYIGSDGWGNNEAVYKNLVKDSPHGSSFIGFRNSYWKEDTDTAMARAFREEYAKRNSHSPTPWSAISFDAAWVLFTAMEKAADPHDGEMIRQQLRSLHRLPVVTSKHFSFGPDNSPRKDLYIYKLDSHGINYEVSVK